MASKMTTDEVASFFLDNSTEWFRYGGEPFDIIPLEEGDDGASEFVFPVNTGQTFKVTVEEVK